MGGLAKTDPRYVIRKGRVGFGANVSITFDRDLVVDASARDALEFCGSALRDWYEEAHRTGQRPDAGLLPRDGNGSSWVAFDTGLLAGNWRLFVAGDDTRASARVTLLPPDRQRALRLAKLASEGIRLAVLSGKAADVYHEAFAKYMSGVVHG